MNMNFFKKPGTVFSLAILGALGVEGINKEMQVNKLKDEVKSLVSPSEFTKIAVNKPCTGLFADQAQDLWQKSLDSLHADAMAKKAYQAGMQAARDSLKAAK